MSDDWLWQWARVLALEKDGSAVRDGQTVRVEMGGPRGSLQLSDSPETKEEWRDRLQYGEGAAARALIAAPFGFACSLISPDEQAGPGEEVVDLLRLAFGFSLSVGRSCRRRFTAYLWPEKESGFIRQGRDRLFELAPQTGPLDWRDPGLPAALPRFFTLVRQAEAAYQAEAEVEQQVDKLRDALSAELRALERFYAPGRDRVVSSHGNPPEGLRGEDIAEAEFSSKMEDIVEKYRAAVLFEPLSLARVRCLAGVDGQHLRLPFLDLPAPFRPLDF